ncbi:uncharacterized protein LOC105179520 isoform X2 [Sesamum indicum]|uniref:Uncharacterized protein LOC105179520 isoform X2 n=1 Tax=Sesamum indicum TaxID=4182 RepID=A0A6I9UPK6_SESIN|nr:uncharacterized protein LOC105179520 isoform X2 [Sesamum indicum]
MQGMEKDFELVEEYSPSPVIGREDHQVDGEWQTVRRKNRRRQPLRILSTHENSCGTEQQDRLVADAVVMESSSGNDVEMDKRPKVTVAEAFRNINVTQFASFIADISGMYERMHDVQLMRFTDYFRTVLAKVSHSQFPWIEILKDSSVAKMVDIPLVDIPEEVYKISVDWLSSRAVDALGSFVLWLLDSIVGEFEIHQGVAKATKNAIPKTPPKCQVVIFVVLAMILRCKPDLLIILLPIIKDSEKYKGHDKIPVMVWVIAQASQGDLGVGLFLCVHFLFNMLKDESSSNMQSWDFILQVIERIVSSPKARIILLNRAVRKGERLVPPSALEFLMRTTFSGTERLQVVYPTLKEVAIAAPSGSKTLKQITQKIMLFAIKAAGEGIVALSQEAGDLCIWCLTMNQDCYKQWEDIYLENIEGSILVLKKLLDGWKAFSVKQHTLHPLKESIQRFRVKNQQAMAGCENAAYQASLRVAEKYCKMLSGKISPGQKYMRIFVLAGIAGIVVGINAAFLFKDLKSSG